jgi:hypothetical protein
MESQQKYNIYEFDCFAKICINIFEFNSIHIHGLGEWKWKNLRRFSYNLITNCSHANGLLRVFKYKRWDPFRESRCRVRRLWQKRKTSTRLRANTHTENNGKFLFFREQFFLLLSVLLSRWLFAHQILKEHKVTVNRNFRFFFINQMRKTSGIKEHYNRSLSIDGFYAVFLLLYYKCVLMNVKINCAER